MTPIFNSFNDPLSVEGHENFSQPGYQSIFIPPSISTILYAGHNVATVQSNAFLPQPVRWKGQRCITAM
jgi:hypothetical protein